MGGKMSRSKGKRGELQAAAELRRVFGCQARRSQQFSGADHDADLTTDMFGLHAEVKRTERLELYKSLEQSTADSSATDCPVVLHRRNHKPWVLIVSLEDLPGLVALINEYMEKQNDG